MVWELILLTQKLMIECNYNYNATAPNQKELSRDVKNGGWEFYRYLKLQTPNHCRTKPPETHITAHATRLPQSIQSILFTASNEVSISYKSLPHNLFSPH